MGSASGAGGGNGGRGNCSRWGSEGGVSLGTATSSEAPGATSASGPASLSTDRSCGPVGSPDIEDGAMNPTAPMPHARSHIARAPYRVGLIFRCSLHALWKADAPTLEKAPAPKRLKCDPGGKDVTDR
jgi:hypothetical protein